MTAPRCEVIGDCRLILGDCRELLEQFDTRWALISDPPYGIGFDWGKDRTNRKTTLTGTSKMTNAHRPEAHIHGDDAAFDPRPWLAFRQVILWGANNYAGLPPARCWLVWDKRKEQKPDNHGDAELAWTNLPGVICVHRQIWRGVVREGDENATFGPKLHPAQKPLRLCQWCVAMTTGTVLDPFAGSFSVGVACVNLGRPFVGVEIDEKYWEIGCSRIEKALQQERLFPLPAVAPGQPGLFPRATEKEATP